MEGWNARHPESPTNVNELKNYLQTHAFFNMPISLAISIMEGDFQK